jgi:hypothetical protein
MIHVGLHNLGHKKFGRQNLKNKNMLCRVSREDTRQRVLCRVPNIWHSVKKPLCRVPTLSPRQRLTAVSSRTAADGPLPSVTIAECLTLGKYIFAECSTVPSVLHLVNHLVSESRNSPRAALGKATLPPLPSARQKALGKAAGTRQSPGFR